MLSLIVPAYNEQRYIVANLRSLLAQTYKKIEIIVIDNNSTDRTAELAKMPGVRLVKEARQGWPYAVAKGIRVSRGEFFAVCDADSRYPPDFARKVIKAFSANPNVVGVYGPIDIWDDSRIVSAGAKAFFTAWGSVSLRLGQPFSVGMNFAIRKSAYRSSGGYDVRAYDGSAFDVFLGRRLMRLGKVVYLRSNVVSTSSRRIRKEGLLRATRHFVESQMEVARGSKPKVSYKQYNKTYR